MENRAHALVAGLFVIFLSIAVVIIALWFNGKTIQRSDYIVVTNKSVTGLSVQAAVHYRGVNIGRVENIYFNPEDLQQILINISIRQDIILTESVFAQLNYQGVTGLAYIQLNDDGSQSEPMHSAKRIPMRPSLLEEVAGSGQDLLSNVNKLTNKLNFLLNEKNQIQISHILDNIETGTRHFDGIAKQMQPVFTSLLGLTAETDSLVKNLNQLLTEINQVVINVNQQGGIIDNMSQSIEEFSTTLPELRKASDGITRNSQHLDHLLFQLQANPQSLLFGKPPSQPGPGEDGFSSPLEITTK